MLVCSPSRFQKRLYVYLAESRIWISNMCQAVCSKGSVCHICQCPETYSRTERVVVRSIRRLFSGQRVLWPTNVLYVLGYKFLPLQKEYFMLSSLGKQFDCSEVIKCARDFQSVSLMCECKSCCMQCSFYRQGLSRWEVLLQLLTAVHGAFK